ncbi:MAG: right-handed parallel beta-helix repeat-containing protein, partial [Ktedonobacterales bacterium]
MRRVLRLRAFSARQPLLWAGVCLVGIALVTGSALVLRFGTAHAAGTTTDTTCTSASYSADITTWTTTLAGNGTIQVNCPSPTTIDITSGAGGPGTVPVSGTQLLAITSTGHALTLSGATTTELFDVSASTASLSLTGLTLAKGSNFLGGAITNSGTVTITNSTLSNNAAFADGAIDNDGTLTITNSTLSNNFGFSGVGGIASSGTLTITNSTLSGNSTIGQGGAIYVSSGTLSITGSTLSGNSVTGSSTADSGALYAASGTNTITTSTFSGNTAVGGSGATEVDGGA